MRVPAIIDDYVAALNAHDPDAFAALHTEDAVFEQVVKDGLVFRGREEIRGWLVANIHAAPDFSIATDAVIADGDRIAWAWSYRAAYTGQYPGYPAGHGQPIALRVCALLELREGRIAHETHYYDNYTFLSQTGVLST